MLREKEKRGKKKKKKRRRKRREKEGEKKVDNKESIVESIKNEGPKIRTSGDRMLYVKKKLTPLKKGFSGDPMPVAARDKRNLKITFLNIEKL